MYWVYILKNKLNGRYYVGHTNNLTRRIEEHNSGRSRYTKRKGIWILVYVEEFVTRAEAMKRELEIKNRKSRKFIEGLIRNKTVG